ncbi:MAG TPA: Fe-S cluster assembly protein SufD [Actinomycetota bacterium]|nr:Fe-S cluster assembly protein SufD [Actinomycetota bacterium]
MAAVTTTTFDERALDALPNGSASIAAQRRRALELFRSMPLPSQETEEWRYTDLSDFDLDFAAFTPGGTATSLDEVPTDLLGAAGDVQERAGLLIQHNSQTTIAHLDPAIRGANESETEQRSKVHFESIDAALRDHPEIVEPYLHALVPADRTKFTALHATFRTGGTFVLVPDGTRVDLPIQALTYLDADGAALFPHTLLIVGRDAEVTFIDRYVSPDLGRAFSDAVTEIFVGDGAHVRYVSIQEWGSGVTHLGIQRASVGRDATFRSLNIGFGAGLARAETETVLAEPGGFSEMLGVFFADEDQHFDHRSIQDHLAPNCTSDLLYKGALRDRSRAVYSGWVHVRPDAQKTNAMQTSRNIVLSEHAKADAIPNLEIEANDVRCGHAASVGPVDEDAIFYLTSRGIPRDEAERLIVSGFFQEVLDRVKIDEVREGAEQAIQDELARGRDAA